MYMANIFPEKEICKNILFVSLLPSSFDTSSSSLKLKKRKTRDWRKKETNKKMNSFKFVMRQTFPFASGRHFLNAESRKKGEKSSSRFCLLFPENLIEQQTAFAHFNLNSICHCISWTFRCLKLLWLVRRNLTDICICLMIRPLSLIIKYFPYS